MSGPTCNTRPTTIKTEPGDDYNDVPLRNNKSDYLQDFCSEDPGGVNSQSDREYASCNSKEIAEKLKGLKRSDSDGDPGCDSDLTLADFYDVEVDMGDSYEEAGYHSHEYDRMCSADTLNMDESEDRKPSQEELEMYSKDLNLKRSVHEREHISSVVSSVSDNFHVDKTKSTSKFRDLNLRTPRVVLPRLSASQLSSFSCNKHAESSLTKKRNCTRMFIESEIMKPIFNDDGVVTSYECVGCLKKFIKRHTLRQHFITHTDRFPCPHCMTRCKSKGDLARHIQTHTKEKPFHCNVCNCNYTRLSILKRHRKTQRHLQLLFESKNLAHLKMVKNKQKHVDTSVTSQADVRLGLHCSPCQKGTFSIHDYRKHIKSHTLKYICDVCHKGCKSLPLLKIHKKAHSKSTSLVCKVCFRSFANFHYLKEHSRSHKPGSLNGAMKECSLKSTIGNHRRIFPGVKAQLQQMNQLISAEGDQIAAGIDELECDDCHKRFSRSRHLTSHKCTAAVTYICGKCNKTFPTICKLKTHMKLHSRIIKCDICDIVFYEETELEEHIEEEHVDKVFTGGHVDGFTCTLCYDHFDNESDLKDHMKDHSPTMLFSGQSLGEKKTALMITQSKQSNSASVVDVTVKTEVASDSEGKRVSKRPEKAEAAKYSGSDDDSILDSKDSYEIMDRALVGSDNRSHEEGENNVSDSNLSDTDEELYSGIQTTFENEVLSSDESDLYELEEFNESQHEKQLVSQIKGERKRLCISKKWKGVCRASSASEKEMETKMIKYGDSKGEPSEAESEANFLITLSHNEILQANKHNFAHFSCSDYNKNIFSCKICKSEYARATTLTRHMKTHVCEFCSKFFKDKLDLFEHRYSHRKRAALLKAEITGEDTTIRPCSVVSKPNRIKFKEYSFVDTSRNIYQCTLCQRDFVRGSVLTRHMKTHICGRCDKFYEDKYELAKHYLYHPVGEHNLEEEKADDVADSDELSDVDREEELPVSSIVQNKEVCLKDKTLLPSIPQPGISLSGQTQSAYSTKSDKVTFPQVLTSASDEAAGAEVMSIVPDSNKLPFPAISQPVEVFINTAYLAASASYQDNSKNMTASPQPVVEMPVISEQERRFKCGECGKTFLKNNHLMSHLTIHTGDRPFMCSQCGKSFGRRSTLYKHKKTHTKPC